MLHKILSKVATNHLWDFGSARIAFSGFDQIGREDYFYRSADLFNLNDWIEEANALRTFMLRCVAVPTTEVPIIRKGPTTRSGSRVIRAGFAKAVQELLAQEQTGFKQLLIQKLADLKLEDTSEPLEYESQPATRCYEAGNLEAIYIRGMYEFFVLHLLDEGREKIRLAGERGLLLAKYVDGMLNLAFSVDARGFVHNYPSFSREFVDRMNYMITTSVFSGYWDYEKPQVFMSLLERIDPNVSHDCWCSAVIESVFVVSLDGSRTRWTCDCCFWQCAAWDFCNDIHLTAANWPIED
ncbi:hypothetical protein F2Q69_00024094 [Brassica cretica]|uniref:At2g35280-like TPR domain-containing protein n=1 Tax=Brassica cretica TaxID=69181 RepID=A0A8S9Q8T9_BRACR|nr:hypothetical protein F2Q69_00024094 [Brassica cretica]